MKTISRDKEQGNFHSLSKKKKKSSKGFQKEKAVHADSGGT